MELKVIELDSFEWSASRRPVDPANVARLAASIREVGLQTPLTVRLRPEGLDTRVILVAGRHRLEALRTLGEQFADCQVIADDDDLAELWEIDENFARAELTDAQRADHHVRREAILVRRGEAAKPGKGGDRRSTASSAIGSYSKKAAGDLGFSERTVRQDLARGKKIAPAVLAAVSGTALDKGVVLDELARTPVAQQPARLDEIRAQRDAHKVNREHNRVIALTEAEQFAAWLMARIDVNDLPTIIAWLDGTKPRDVIAALRREAQP